MAGVQTLQNTKITWHSRRGRPGGFAAAAGVGTRNADAECRVAAVAAGGTIALRLCTPGSS